MDISVLGVSRPSASGRQVVQFRTDFGSATACWFGDATVLPGEYSVEFDIGREDLSWGRDVRPAETQAPGVRESGDQIVLRGLLELAADGHVSLRLGYSLSLLGVVDSVPAVADRTWVELVVDSADVTLYPYDS
ncbi:hypothetical protein R8Z50_23060 [Longispora sp. K20-0274]|uniref:hypothetical protein n=1 Tax=Longispora sp. K20-0274 TaxID=3088255 RepID=UPI003999F40A